MHEEKLFTGPPQIKRTRHLIYVAAQDRGQIGIDHCRVAAPDQFGEAGDGGGGGHLREAGFAGDRGDAILMVGVEIGVQPGDGHGADAVFVRGLQMGADGGLIKRGQNRAIGVQTFVHFDHAFIKQVGALDFQIKKPGSGLVAYFQQVAETRRDDQQHAFALAFQKRVGGHGRAHLDRADGPRRDVARDTHHFANALHGSIGVAVGVFREKFVGVHVAVRVHRHDIREGAAPVDPEFPHRCHLFVIA